VLNRENFLLILLLFRVATVTMVVTKVAV